MTAYGAVISLQNTIDYILHSSHFTLVNEPSPTIIRLAYNELQALQVILVRLDSTRTSRSRKKVNELDGRMKEKIWEFEDKLESLLYQQILPQFPVDGGMEELLFSIDLHSLQDDVASFVQMLKEMEKEYIYELENMPQEPFSTTIGFDFGEIKSKMIGLSDILQQMKDVLLDVFHLYRFPVIIFHQIKGMAGIGKTALAKELYEDANIVRHFDCRAWVTVTRTMVHEGPQFDEVVQGIFAQLCDGDDNSIGVGDYLEGKNCLLVLDDVWEDWVLDCLQNSFREHVKGFFYILVTTREKRQTRSTHTDARFLTEEESMELLCEKVFGGKELCPNELHKAATKIAKKCEGLPLMIVTVADILSKSQNTDPEYWEDVAEERNSVFTDAYKEISKVLYPSYDYLSQCLKMPFLFMGVFPPNYEIPTSKLTDMLHAEGWFALKTNYWKGSFWKYLDQLCTSRYLVLFKTKSANWNTDFMNPDPISIYKASWLHSSWRYTCREEARKNKLFHVFTHLLDDLEEGSIKGHRCLCLHNNILFAIKEFCYSVRLNCASFARSVLFLGPYHQYPTPIDVGFRLLRELDALKLRFYTFPPEILMLVQLEYLALACNGELPTTISKLFNLRVLIIHPHMIIRRCRAPSYIPVQIWDMKKLKHIEILGKSLRVPNHVASLANLSTLIGVNASISTIIELSKRIPYIKKLGVQVELTPYDDHINLLSCFACISTLDRLLTLKCSIINPVIQQGYIVPEPPSSLMLPRGLRKLHLSGTGFPWEYMDAIGSLPYLKVLKLRSYAFRGSIWEAPQFERFPCLEFLLIEDSDLVCLNLPQWVKRVSIKHCYKLVRIHWLVHDYKKRKIELVDCNPLAFTWAKEFQPSDKFSGDVTISSSFEAKPMIINITRDWESNFLSQQRRSGDGRLANCRLCRAAAAAAVADLD